MEIEFNAQNFALGAATSQSSVYGAYSASGAEATDGNLGNFTSKELSLRPGTYVAVGVRPGYRDVRQEFRVAPEVDMQPVVVRCEEAI
jgi:hypothetical protein